MIICRVATVFNLLVPFSEVCLYHVSFFLARVDLQVEGNLILAKMFFPPVELIFHNHNFEFDSSPPVSFNYCIYGCCIPIKLYCYVVECFNVQTLLLKQVLFPFVLLADL